VFVTGSFDDWGKTVQLDRNGDVFEKEVQLPSADKVHYKVSSNLRSFSSSHSLLYFVSITSNVCQFDADTSGQPYYVCLRIPIPSMTLEGFPLTSTDVISPASLAPWFFWLSHLPDFVLLIRQPSTLDYLLLFTQLTNFF
jgi:hypothetical protein